VIVKEFLEPLKETLFFPRTSPPHSLLTVHVAPRYLGTLPSFLTFLSNGGRRTASRLGFSFGHTGTGSSDLGTRGCLSVWLKQLYASQIFRRVEEESERRAQVEEMADVAARQQTTPLPAASMIPIFQQPEDGGEDTTPGTAKSEKIRRRGSLSVSRFGQVRRGQAAVD